MTKIGARWIEEKRKVLKNQPWARFEIMPKEQKGFLRARTWIAVNAAANCDETVVPNEIVGALINHHGQSLKIIRDEELSN